MVSSALSSKTKRFFLTVLLFTAFAGQAALAQGHSHRGKTTVPGNGQDGMSTQSGSFCPDNNGNNIPINNSQVLQWKTSTHNQFLARAHVKGVVMDVYPDHSGHNHFAIDLDSNPNDGLEVVYNISFGDIPGVNVGDMVEACGDYITSDEATSQYPASPMGAIIHWIHRNPSGQGHPSGFLIINGQLYGQGNGEGA